MMPSLRSWISSFRIARHPGTERPDAAYGRQDRGDERLLTASQWEKLIGRGGFKLVRSSEYHLLNRPNDHAPGVAGSPRTDVPGYRRAVASGAPLTASVRPAPTAGRNASPTPAADDTAASVGKCGAAAPTRPETESPRDTLPRSARRPCGCPSTPVGGSPSGSSNRSKTSKTSLGR